MNSPPDHGSPASTSSSESPPPDEAFSGAGGSSYLSNLTSHITNIGNFSGPGPSKRRLPQGSSFGAASSTRDPKSRRRERERGEPSRPGHPAWEKESGSGKKEPKDDLLDQGLVEHLRKEIGDPFLEIGIKG